MTQPLISIVGPTATGKTQFAIAVAEKLGITTIISADSRQVYKGMEIGTGVDVPVLGTSLLRPNEEWSVAHFHDFVQNTLKTARGPVIVVGGTGLYHRYFSSTDPQLKVAPNKVLRAAEKDVTELQNELQKISPARLSQMNNSDRNNPRRLVRAIEIAAAQPSAKLPKKTSQITIGFTAPLEYIHQKIAQRVRDRLENGMIEEVQRLMADYSEEDWRKPAFSATGYKEVRAFLEDKISKEQMIELWTRREFQYAKRQITWWKKEPNVQWFDVTQDGWQKLAIEMIYSLHAQNL